jgi:class 3 adenylate cyclase/CHASE2 domain-containing sensor protein
MGFELRTLTRRPWPAWAQRPRAWLITGFGVLLVLALLRNSVPAINRLELALIDLQWQVLRQWRGPTPLPAPADVLVITIDEQSLAQVPEPLALWHRPLGRLFGRLADAGVQAVLVDMALPERSFDAVVPGIDRELLQGIARLTKAAPVVFAVMADPDGQPRPIWPDAAAVAGPQAFALALLPVDADGQVRRLAHRSKAEPDGTPTLAEAVYQRLKPQAPRPLPGAMIDYSLGPMFDTVPLQRLLADPPDAALLARLKGRTVAVGSALAFSDRLLTPVPLAPGRSNLNDAPGVLLHAQSLRTLLAQRAVVPAPAWVPMLLALAVTLVWWVPTRGWRGPVISIGTVAALLVLSTLALQWGVRVPVAAAVASVLVASSTRKALDASLALRERGRLRSAFGGYVSPQVLQQMLDGRLDASRPDGPRPMAFLFADLRGFTARSQTEAAQETIGMLNRYYDAIIAPIHQHGGTVDNFRGDGIMVVFGAPLPLANPARAAVLAAGGMVQALARLNQALAAEGGPQLEMGIGIAYGDAVAGNVGSASRHDYTAIGDDVNVAARLQDQCKPQQARAVASAVVQGFLQPGDAQCLPLGELALKGHTPVAAVALAWPASLPAPAGLSGEIKK